MSHLAIDEKDRLRRQISALDAQVAVAMGVTVVDFKAVSEMKRERHSLVLRLSVLEDRSR